MAKKVKEQKSKLDKAQDEVEKKRKRIWRGRARSLQALIEP